MKVKLTGSAGTGLGLDVSGSRWAVRVAIGRQFASAEKHRQISVIPASGQALSPARGSNNARPVSRKPRTIGRHAPDPFKVLAPSGQRKKRVHQAVWEAITALLRTIFIKEYSPPNQGLRIRARAGPPQKRRRRLKAWPFGGHARCLQDKIC